MPTEKPQASARKLRHRVVVQKWVDSGTDTRGHATGNWVDVGRIYAQIEPMGPRLAEMARQTVEHATHRVTIRYQEDLNRKGWRLRYRARTFAVGHVENVNEMNHTLVLTASEVI